MPLKLQVSHPRPKTTHLISGRENPNDPSTASRKKPTSFNKTVYLIQWSLRIKDTLGLYKFKWFVHCIETVLF